jgi:RNA polymerase sigma-70 factor (ECF subfamily)
VQLRRLVSADDLVQETLMHAFRGIGQARFDDDRAFRAWLFRIAQNVLNGNCRRLLGTDKRDAMRDVRLPSSANGMALPAPATAPPHRIEREERLQRLERALADLSAEHRQVIVLARIEGLPLSAVAERMDRSRKAVSALLLRALGKLRFAFGETGSLSLPRRALRLAIEGRGGSASGG